MKIKIVLSKNNVASKHVERLYSDDNIGEQEADADFMSLYEVLEKRRRQHEK